MREITDYKIGNAIRYEAKGNKHINGLKYIIGVVTGMDDRDLHIKILQCTKHNTYNTILSVGDTFKIGRIKVIEIVGESSKAVKALFVNSDPQ